MTCRCCDRRSGAIAIMTAILLLVVIAVAAVSLDSGYIFLTQTELQAACDSSALAGGTELFDGLGVDRTKTPAQVDTAARDTAVSFAAMNYAGDRLAVFADSGRDIRLGRARFDIASGTWIKTWDVGPYNMVRVRLHRNKQGSSDGDGPLGLLLGPIVGQDSASLAVYATAVTMPASGFAVTPGSSETAQIMPFAFRRSVWERRQLAQDYQDDNPASPLTDNPHVYQKDGNGNLILDDDGNPIQDVFDNYGYTESDGNYTITNGADGTLEVDLYPEDPGNTGNTAGNSGTIDFGSGNNSTTDIARQIRTGLSDSDLSYFDNGEIVFNDDNPALDVEGDTGISGGPIEAALNDILGEPRAIALFDLVQNPGNTAIYTLVEFVGVRVMYANLNGGSKHVWIQPAKLVDGNAVPDLEEEPGDDTSIFTSLILID